MIHDGHPFLALRRHTGVLLCIKADNSIQRKAEDLGFNSWTACLPEVQSVGDGSYLLCFAVNPLIVMQINFLLEIPKVQAGMQGYGGGGEKRRMIQRKRCHIADNYL